MPKVILNWKKTGKFSLNGNILKTCNTNAVVLIKSDYKATKRLSEF